MPAAGHSHTVLLRSDGRAVAVGDDRRGQCRIPELEAGARYVTDRRAGEGLIVHLSVSSAGPGSLTLTCEGLAGAELAQLVVQRTDRAAAVHRALAARLQVRQHNLRAALPDGRLLGDCAPAAPIAEIVRPG